jgi:DNA-binding NarL/FixJ family response regulator
LRRRIVIRVLLVDDEELVRSGLRLLLATDPDIEIVAEATDGAEAVALTRELHPDVVLLDLHMPRVDGLTALARLRAAAGRAPRVIVLTTFGEDHNVYLALRAGASAFLLKTSRAEDLRRAVHAVADGEQVVSPVIIDRLVQRFLELPPPGYRDQTLAELSDREIDVLRHIARGMSNAEVGEALYLSEATVKSHINHLLRKLGLRDRVQATVLAYETGLVRPGGTSDDGR